MWEIKHLYQVTPFCSNTTLMIRFMVALHYRQKGHLRSRSTWISNTHTVPNPDTMPNSINQPSVPLSSKLSEVISVSKKRVRLQRGTGLKLEFTAKIQDFIFALDDKRIWWCWCWWWWRHNDPDVERCCCEINATFYDLFHTSLIGTNFELVPMLSNFYGQTRNLFRAKTMIKMSPGHDAK